MSKRPSPPSPLPIPKPGVILPEVRTPSGSAPWPTSPRRVLRTVPITPLNDAPMTLNHALNAAIACAETLTGPPTAADLALFQQLSGYFQSSHDRDSESPLEPLKPMPPSSSPVRTNSKNAPRNPRHTKAVISPPTTVTDTSSPLSRLLASIRRLASDLPLLPSAVVMEAKTLFGADDCHLWQAYGTNQLLDRVSGAIVPLQGLCGRVATSATPIVCDNVAEEPQYVVKVDGDVFSCMCFPAGAPDAPATVLCVGRSAANALPFNAQEVQMMDTFTAVIAVAMAEGTNAPKSVDSGILQANNRITQCNSQATLDQVILDCGPSLCGANAAALFHIDHHFNCMIHAWSQQTFSLQKGIVGYVAATQQTTNMLPDEFARLYDPEVDNTFGYPITSMLCVPILTAGRVSAVLQLVNKRTSSTDGKGFTVEDERAVKTLAKYAGFAMRRVKDSVRCSGLRREQAVLQCIRKLPSTTNMELFATQVAQDVRTLLYADGGAVFVIECDGQEVDGFYEGNEEGALADSSLVGRVVESGQVINLTDYNLNEGRGNPKICALLIVPVMFDNFVVGALQAMNVLTNKPFMKADEEMLLMYAQSLSSLLHDVQVIARSQLDFEQLAVMLDVAKELCMTELDDYYQVIRAVMEKARELTGADRCSIFLVDKSRNLLEGHLLAAGGREASTVNLPLRGSKVGFACHVALTGEAVRINNAYDDPRFDPSVDELTGYTTRTILCMPVYRGEEIIAVVQVVNKVGNEPNVWPPFKKQDEKILSTFVAYAGMTLRNARLFRELSKKQQTINTLEELSFALACDLVDHDKLLAKVVEYARDLTGADRCSLFLVDKQGQQLVGHLQGQTIAMPMSSGIAGWVAANAATLNVSDAYKDPRFNKAVDALTGYRTKTLLCMPVMFQGEVEAVVQLVNKPDGFTAEDEEVFSMFAQWVGVSLRNCKILQELSSEKRKSDLVKKALSNMFVDVRRGWAEVMERISEGAKSLLYAERVTVFAVDKAANQLVSTLADKTGGHQIRIKISQGVAGMVATSGKALNIRDAYSDKRFDAEVDKLLGFRTKCLLTHPVMHDGEVIAVLQLLNKTNGASHFTSEDEELLSYYAFFAGLALTNVKLYDFMLNSTTRALRAAGRVEKPIPNPIPDPGAHISQSTGAFPLMEEEELRILVDEYLEAPVSIQEIAAVKTQNFDIHEYRRDRSRRGPKVIRLLLELFRDLGIIEMFKVNEQQLMRFFIQVARMYRDIPYHNFFHAFDVAQTVYLMIKSCDKEGLLQPLDRFILMVTALLHDVDHMGLNNHFHLKVSTPMGSLAAVSGLNSVLELHHCSIATTLLSHDSFNIFRSLSPKERGRAYQAMIECILATDMSKQRDVQNQVRELTGQPRPPSGTPESDTYQSTILKMIIISADLSNIAKPFEVARQWAISITDEFHMQGDIEKTEGLEVAALFDRDQQGELALGQIGFINAIGMRHYEELAALCPGWNWMLDNLKDNLNQWTALLH